MAATSRSLSLAFSVLLVSLAAVSATDYGYNSLKSSSEKMLTKVIGIQGTIYCKTGSRLMPIKGAIARITCLAVDKKGYETAPFSILSNPADAKGYYFATLSPAELEKGWRLTKCKVFLEKSPVKSCNVPTDVNKGKTGATLSSPRLLKTMNLYSIPAFVYTPEAPAAAAAMPPAPRAY